MRLMLQLTTFALGLWGMVVFTINYNWVLFDLLYWMEAFK